MIAIDGSHGEGGGQILRTSLALSLLTGKPFRMAHIRARRSKPGLQPQHLISVKAAARVGNAKVEGAELNSQSLTFEPGPVQAGEYHFSIGTAGATGLILHTVYLPLALSGQDSHVVIEGGTHVPASPCFHFLDTTWRRYMQAIGLEIEMQMERPGFFPRGGGRIEATIRGRRAEQLRGLRIESLPRPQTVTGFSAVAGLPEEIADRQARRARERLDRAGWRADIDLERWPGGPGTVLGLTLDTGPAPTFFFALGARGKRAEAVADEAVAEALRFLDADTPGIDAHSADQLLLPLVVAPEASHFPVAWLTEHLFTNRETIGQFLPRTCQVRGSVGKPGSVDIYTNKK